MYWYAGHLEREIILVAFKSDSCEALNMLIRYWIPEKFLNAQQKQV